MYIKNINTQAKDNSNEIQAKAKTTENTAAEKFQEVKNIEETQAAIVSAGEMQGTEETSSIYTEDLDKEDEKAAADKKAKKESSESLEDASKTMSEKDYDALMEEGISLESYEAGQLERALIRIKANIDSSRESTDAFLEDKKDMRETVQKIAIANKISDPIAKKIASKLIDANLPVTEENMVSLFNAMGLTNAALNVSDGAKAYLIDNEQELTVENLYHSRYSAFMAAGKKEGFEAVEAQAEKIIMDADLPVNETTKEQARWLYENNLPVTKESLKMLNAVEEVSKNADEDYVLDKMTEAIGKGLPPEQANLDETNHRQVEEAIKKFDELYLNLSDLTDLKSITAKRQLEEIRLKMTTEAGVKLLKRGIRLDTTDLQKVVEGLKELENEYYKNRLDEVGAKSDEASVNLLKSTTEKLEFLREAPAYILGRTLAQKRMMTTGILYEEAVSMKQQLDKASDSYEALMTKPRSDMGDSIQKAFQNVPDILKDLGMEDNQANQRAVRILAYNRMEINEISIQSVKNYDSKVNDLLKELKPSVTAELIKRDVNPLDTEISELTQQVKEIKEELGAGDEEKYSKYLWQLEKNGEITPEERKSYIGVYRLLNNVQKTDGAAIGAVLNNGMDLTLKNLLTAVRSAKASGINVEIDDSYGDLDSLTFSKDSITEQIKTAFSKEKNVSGDTPDLEGTEETLTYYKEVLDRIIDNISPDKLNPLLEKGLSGLMDMSLEKMEDKLEQAIEDNKMDREYASYQTEKLRDIAKTAKDAIDLLENYQIEPTLKNIVAAQTFFTNDKNFYKEFEKYADKEYNDLIKGIPEAMEDAGTMEEMFSKVEEKVQTLLKEEYNNQMDEESHDKVDELHLFGNGIELARRLSRQEYYEIPIVTGEEVTCMNLTLLKGTNEKGKIQISMETGSYGKLTGEFSVKGQTIKGFILCDTKDGLQTMEAVKERMKDGLKDLGLEVKQLTAGYERQTPESIAREQRMPDSEPGTRLLYQAAKVIVKSIAEEIKA